MQSLPAVGTQPGHNQAGPQPRLVRAAHEFEAQMMKDLMKPMTASDPLTGDDENSSSGSGGALGEFATEALSRAVSDRGGFGIANAIIHQVSSSSNKTPVTR